MYWKEKHVLTGEIKRVSIYFHLRKFKIFINIKIEIEISWRSSKIRDYLSLVERLVQRVEKCKKKTRNSSICPKLKFPSLEFVFAKFPINSI